MKKLIFVSVIYLLSISCGLNQIDLEEIKYIEVYRISMDMRTMVKMEESVFEVSEPCIVKDEKEIENLRRLILDLTNSNDTHFVNDVFIGCKLFLPNNKEVKLLYNKAQIKFGDQIYSRNDELINTIIEYCPIN